MIKSNSEKSKHLETAVIKLFGVFVDLVNLRSEEYAKDSRIPEISIGTPEQDAFRRDLTFNSLFYNINANKIEDFTGRGLLDLQNGLCKTPLEPLQTFIDDPLRVLRSIRFALRFGFLIDPSIYQAAKDPQVREAFASKITFERIQKEMDKMFESREAYVAVQRMHDFGITQLCIKAPTQIDQFKDEQAISRFLVKSV